MRHALIGAGFSLLGGTGLHRWAAPAFRGLGAILMMHRVRPFEPRAFEPNRLLEITERSARLWWVELEEAVRNADTIDVEIGGTPLSLRAVTPDEKQAAFTQIYRRLRAGSEEELLHVIGQLAQAWGVDRRRIVDDLCMDWDDIETLASHPLATIGAHTITHPRLARLGEAEMRTEIGASRSELEDRLARPVCHLAYPVGDAGSAASREFCAASDFGFATAVTTRPGLIYPAHAAHMTALPRVSVNGHWQEPRHIEVRPPVAEPSVAKGGARGRSWVAPEAEAPWRSAECRRPGFLLRSRPAPIAFVHRRGGAPADRDTPSRARSTRRSWLAAS